MKKYSIIFMIYIILLSSFCSYDHDGPFRQCKPGISFVDSTYAFDKEFYNIGEIIYVHAFESFKSQAPDNIDIEIESGIGDYEIIKASPKVFYGPPEFFCRHYGGYIHSYSTDSVSQNNDILEVHPNGDTLHAIYKINRFIRVFDEAVIEPF